MNHPEFNLPLQHRPILDRFIAACQVDERVIAAILSGSYARGAADEFSDLDMGLITTDETYQDFILSKWTFIQKLGEPLFQEDFGNQNIALFIFSSGAECELAIHSQSQIGQLYSVPTQVLFDKAGIFLETFFTPQPSLPADQVETLRRLIFWFWHDLSHFIKAMGRGQLWFAQGELEALRGFCINLARLRHDFAAEADIGEPYFKLENALPVEVLSPLQATFCPLEPDAMLRSAWLILHFYQELARPLAREHGLEYPERLEKMFLGRLSIM